MSSISHGNSTVSDDLIKSLEVTLTTMPSIDQLSIDNAKALINVILDQIPTVFAPSDAEAILTSDESLFTVWPWNKFQIINPASFKYGDDVRIQLNDGLTVLMYHEALKRVGKDLYEINAISAIGLLENQQHFGMMYTGYYLFEVIADIIGGVVPYVLDPELSIIRVYGWLPIGTRRSNLHQVLFAEGLSIKKNASGYMHITALTKDSPSNIPDSRMYIGGSVDEGKKVTKVSVTEHTYAAYVDDETVTLFDGEASASTFISPKGVSRYGVLVTFKGPMHSLSIQNGNILESGVNYAVIGESANCTLTGKSYTHITRVLTRSNAGAAVKENEILVDGATLVSVANSENVADRMASYYFNAYKVKSDVVVANERPGTPVVFNDPFGDRATGFIQQMNIKASGILKADTTMVLNYTPTEPGNNYTDFVVLTGTGVWVPTITGRGRVILISPGDNGTNGGDGAPGNPAKYADGVGGGPADGEPGQGGTAGVGGKGGKILAVNVNFRAGEQISYSCGTSAGQATVFGSMSSLNGFTSETGWVNPLSGVTYALPGQNGVSGGAGQSTNGDRPTINYKGRTYVAGDRGDTEPTYGGPGGYGGGAAAGANGNKGGSGQISWDHEAQGGNGGAGANAVAGDNAVQSAYGNGGNGGNGGGGGGGGATSGGVWLSQQGEGGAGGKGSQGGIGAPGCAIVLYKEG